MANAIVAQAVTRSNVERAYWHTLKGSSSTNETNRIKRGRELLITHQWQFDGEVLRITNSDYSKRYYIGCLDGCTCKGYQQYRHCYHYAAYDLLLQAASYEIERQQVEAELLAEAEAMQQDEPEASPVAVTPAERTTCANCHRYISFGNFCEACILCEELF